MTPYLPQIGTHKYLCLPINDNSQRQSLLITSPQWFVIQYVRIEFLIIGLLRTIISTTVNMETHFN